MGQYKNVPETVVRRLPVYYRFLTNLREVGINRVSSKDLGDIIGITSSQVRQDFSNFGSFGLQGYGYDVEQLRSEISNILGLGRFRKMIIIGAGHLGQALANYFSSERDGYSIVGVFDVNARRAGTRIHDFEIMDLRTLPQYAAENQVDIAVITVPRAYARETVDVVADLGIRGIWNFTSVKLESMPGVCIEDIHLSDSLMTLGFKMKEQSEE